MNLFNTNVNNWNEWIKVKQSISMFKDIIEKIIHQENLPSEQITVLPSSTNAVFKIGEYVLKISPPKESGLDTTSDMQNEIFAATFCNKLNIPTANIIAKGTIIDKYFFSYVVTEYIEGTRFDEKIKTMTSDEKIEIAIKIHQITEKLNTHCERFNSIDVINDEDRQERWKTYSNKFQQERFNYIKNYKYDNFVFVHGDLHPGNVLVTSDNNICLIDFGEATIAPKFYEQSYIISTLFNFDKVLVKSYLGHYDLNKITKLCFNGILIHDFGGDIVKRITKQETINCLDDLIKIIKQKL